METNEMTTRTEATTIEVDVPGLYDEWCAVECSSTNVTASWNNETFNMDVIETGQFKQSTCIASSDSHRIISYSWKV
jgi:hypothetical protein